MKLKVTKKVEVDLDIAYVSIDFPVYDDEEESQIPHGSPMRHGDRWTAIVEIDSGRVLDWPIGKSLEFYEKITDGGTYKLLDPTLSVIAKIEENYVPNDLIPGKYRDYIHLIINESGIITNWPKKPCPMEFFEDED